MPDHNFSDWFSLRWFSLETLMEFHWAYNIFLYAIPVIPFILIFRWALYIRIRQKFDVALHETELKKNFWPRLLRIIPYSFQLLAIILVLVAMARPQIISQKVNQFKEGIDIALVLDLSESMQLTDLSPNRLEASKQFAMDFISRRKNDHIGLVVFGGEAFTICPLTLDQQLIKNSLREVHFELMKNNGTAIGNAIGTAINRLNESPNKSKIILLLSDGENTSGNLSPLQAAELAYAYNIRIHTVGIGKDGDITLSKDSSGRKTYVKSHLDESALRKIAEITKGNFYRANNNYTLSEIFMNIDKLEKNKIVETRYKNTEDYYYPYLFWALLSFLVWIGFKNTPLNNFLED